MYSLHLLIDVSADGIEEFGENLYYYIFMFFGRPFVKRFALCCRTVVCPVCLSVCLSVCL